MDDVSCFLIIVKGKWILRGDKMYVRLRLCCFLFFLNLKRLAFYHINIIEKFTKKKIECPQIKQK